MEKVEELIQQYREEKRTVFKNILSKKIYKQFENNINTFVRRNFKDKVNGSTHSDSEEVKQELLYRFSCCLNDFDLSKGVKFKTFLFGSLKKYLKGSVERTIDSRNNVITSTKFDKDYFMKNMLDDKKIDLEESLYHKQSHAYINNTIGNRNKEIYSLYEMGYTHKEIGEKHNLSKQRVQQIIENIAKKIKREFSYNG